MSRRKNFQAGPRPKQDPAHRTVLRPVLWAENPADRCAFFPDNPSSCRAYDFAPFYDGRIDAITRACHQAVAAMLSEAQLATATIVNYCVVGLAQFLPFCQIWSSALHRALTLDDIDRSFMDAFLGHLRSLERSPRSQSGSWKSTKSILIRCIRSGWISDSGTLFPRNPFAGAWRGNKGQKALSQAERQRVVAALKEDLRAVMESDAPLHSGELALCMLVIGLRSGINPSPLCELPVDCLQLHPLKSNRKLLVSYKRRGNSTYIQALRKSTNVEVAKVIVPDVEQVLQAVIERNASIRAASAEYSDRVFVFERRDTRGKRCASVFKLATLNRAIRRWCALHELLNDDGEPLKLNMMRLRKTFENRIWALSGGDPWVTAKLSGHSLKVSNDHYLEAPKEAEKDFRFMGETLTRELLAQPKVRRLPAESTPVSQCRDPLNGQFAPSARGELCTNFLACVRCRSFVVTEDDLWRLYSFYWLLVSERDLLGSRSWSRHYAHIIRIIDRDIAPLFDQAVVSAARQRAKDVPHPYWRTRDLLDAVG